MLFRSVVAWHRAKADWRRCLNLVRNHVAELVRCLAQKVAAEDVVDKGAECLEKPVRPKALDDKDVPKYEGESCEEGRSA